MKYRLSFASMSLCLLLTSCSNHYYYPHVTYSNEPISLGTVQKKLHKGMCQDKVAYVLGAPNIVTKDKYEREAWIYDKHNTEVSVSESSSGSWLILGKWTGDKHESSTIQKTITIIVKFDENNLVDHISYHTSEF